MTGYHSGGCSAYNIDDSFSVSLRGEQVIYPYRACTYHLAGGFDCKGVAHILKIRYTFHIIIYGELYELQIGPIRQ